MCAHVPILMLSLSLSCSYAILLTSEHVISFAIWAKRFIFDMGGFICLFNIGTPFTGEAFNILFLFFNFFIRLILF